MSYYPNEELKEKVYDDIVEEYLQLGYTEEQISNIAEEMIEESYEGAMEAKGFADYEASDTYLKSCVKSLNK
tara:strand:+ start:116 stop:331 length:216 start_codon:yes stop_codon:yes gene_type:complete